MLIKSKGVISSQSTCFSCSGGGVSKVMVGSTVIMRSRINGNEFTFRVGECVDLPDVIAIDFLGYGSNGIKYFEKCAQ